MDIVQHVAQSVIRNRNYANDKTQTHAFRLRCNQSAANWEHMLIDKANWLMGDHSVHSDEPLSLGVSK